MKKNALVIYCASIVLGIALSVILYFVLSNSVSTYDQAVVITNGQERSVVKGEEAFDILINNLNDSKKVSDKTDTDSSSPDAKIVFMNGGKEIRAYGLYIQSIFKRSAYLVEEKGKDAVRISSDRFTELFSKEPYSDLLTNTEPPVARLLIEDPQNSKKLAIKGYVFEGKWNYATANGTQTGKEIDRTYSDVYSIIKNNSNDLSLLLNSKGYSISSLTIYDENGEIVLHDEEVGDTIPNVSSTGDFIYELTVSWPVSPEIDYNGKITYRFNIDFTE